MQSFEKQKQNQTKNAMRTNSTFGIQFILRMNKIKDNLAPVYCRISIDSQRVEVSLKKSIAPEDWNVRR